MSDARDALAEAIEWADAQRAEQAQGVAEYKEGCPAWKRCLEAMNRWGLLIAVARAQAEGGAVPRDYRADLATFATLARKMMEMHPGCGYCMSPGTGDTIADYKFCPECGWQRLPDAAPRAAAAPEIQTHDSDLAIIGDPAAMQEQERAAAAPNAELIAEIDGYYCKDQATICPTLQRCRDRLAQPAPDAAPTCTCYVECKVERGNNCPIHPGNTVLPNGSIGVQAILRSIAAAPADQNPASGNSIRALSSEHTAGAPAAPTDNAALIARLHELAQWERDGCNALNADTLYEAIAALERNTMTQPPLPDVDATFRDLRTTELNAVKDAGGDATGTAGHASSKTTDRHYLDVPTRVKPRR